eukprot:10572728-Lingulodinium_polyedra.AAC.1
MRSRPKSADRTRNGARGTGRLPRSSGSRWNNAAALACVRRPRGTVSTSDRPRGSAATGANN